MTCYVLKLILTHADITKESNFFAMAIMNTFIRQKRQRRHIERQTEKSSLHLQTTG